MPKHLSTAREAYYPKLRRDGYHVTSNFNKGYNCIAHAAGEQSAPWWPLAIPGIHWPAGAPLEVTVDAFIAAYGTLGYSKCPQGDRSLEPGIEKVALYTDPTGEPTHAAVQLPSGTWSSKLGDWEDIEHKTLEALEDDSQARGLGYGQVAVILRRNRPALSS